MDFLFSHNPSPCFLHPSTGVEYWLPLIIILASLNNYKDYFYDSEIFFFISSRVSLRMVKKRVREDQVLKKKNWNTVPSGIKTIFKCFIC